VGQIQRSPQLRRLGGSLILEGRGTRNQVPAHRDEGPTARAPGTV
jgi:hypothetical protein